MVASAKPVPVREVYGYLVTALAGINEWAQLRGGLAGGVILAAKDGNSDGLVLVMKFGEVEGTRIESDGL